MPMKLFVKEKTVYIIRMTDLANTQQYDIKLNEAVDQVNLNNLKDDTLIMNASLGLIDQALNYLSDKNPKKVDSLTFAVNDQRSAKHFLKSQFAMVKAAGGLVLKDDKILMIYRLGKWDLPKGKLEKDEKSKAGAKREVEEECNIKIAVQEKICATWHTYIRNGKRVLKKTNWYQMSCLDDRNMKPQVEEDIEEVRWMRPREAKVALYNSYSSIRHVFRKYYKMQARTFETD